MIDTKTLLREEPAIKIDDDDDRVDVASSGTSEGSTGSERKKKNIFRKLTKRKCRDEKCESNPNKKPMLILTFALCLIVMVAGGSVKLK